MQNYYRNVALWLATPKQRASMLIAATWRVLVGKHPGAFSHALSIWEIGERVIDVIGRTPLMTEVAMLNEAIVGGLASGLLDLAHQHFVERAQGRESVLNEEAIRQRWMA